MAATMQIKRMTSLTSLLLLAIFTAQTTNAIPSSDIQNLCKEMTDAAFCLQRIHEDPRISAARDLSDVLLIAITQSKMLVDDATTHINEVRGKFSGPNGKRRIEVCKTNYGIASARFHTAWELCLKKSYWDVNKLARIGTNAVIDCENSWRRDGPVQKSPLTLYNMNVFKMSEIILNLIQKLVS